MGVTDTTPILSSIELLKDLNFDQIDDPIPHILIQASGVSLILLFSIMMKQFI